MTNGSINACTGSFQDDNSGGAEGSPYSNTDYIFVICPDNPGDVIQVDFAAFGLSTSPNPNNSDYLTIYDGNNTSFPSLGSYTGNTLQGLAVTGTFNNISGCLTFVFNANLANGAPGWEGLISCTTPCAPPTASSEIQNPLPDGLEQSVSVCVDAPVTFADNGSLAAPGFTLEQYIWNFDDGTVDTSSGPIVERSFSEPGEYVVTLTVVDNNGCNSLNLEPLQVLVSTIPIMNVAWEEEICLGSVAELSADPESVTWTALPPQVVAGETYLADGAGFSYSTSLVFDFFEPGAVLQECDDLLEVFVNMEHSYMGDLQIQLTCPDGTTVAMLEWPNGGGGTFLGEAVDDGSVIPGDGFEYAWAPDAILPQWDTPSNWQMSSYINNAGQNVTATILPTGTYQSDQNLCNFVGCPLNGEWTLTVIDNLAIDNGYIFYWGINFDPYLYPGVTTFTPIIGMGPDSTYWEGPFVVNTSPNGNFIEVQPDQPGEYDYTFFATNNFGCTFDTTVTVTVNPGPQPDAGEDIFLCLGQDTLLIASLMGEELAACSQDAGTYNYCYGNFANNVFTYCPDTQGDGVTFMDISFLQGSTEFFFDQVNIYDGPNTNSSLLASLEGPLAGQTFVATNPTGCITLQIASDGSVSCQDGFGFIEELVYDVGCSTGGPSYEVEWSPGTSLSSTNETQPSVLGLTETTTYTLAIYPTGYPECGSTDQVTVYVGEEVEAGESAVAEFCGSFGLVNMIQYLGGNPDSGGTWTNEQGEEVSATFNTLTDEPGVFTYTVADAGCIEEATLEIILNEVTIAASADTTVCMNGTATLQILDVSGNVNQDIEFVWNNGDFFGETYSFEPTLNPTPVTVYGVFDGNCETNLEQILVFVLPPLQMNLMNDAVVCLADSLELEANNVSGGLPPYQFSWASDNGESLEGNPIWVVPGEETTYCLTLSDACETSPVADCVTVELEEIISTDFTADITSGCNPIFVNFEGFATNTSIIAGVLWEFGDGTTSYTYPLASHFYENPGIYNVTLTLTSTQGCVYTQTAENYIASWPVPVAAFSTDPQTAYLPDTHFQFNNLSMGHSQSLWSFGSYGFSTEDSPEFEFPILNPESVQVQLIVQNTYGCYDTVSRYVFINEDFVLYVPNAFTPDGDGFNDLFVVYGQDVNPEEYLLQVFNRWGEVVFETSNIQEFWDGSYPKDNSMVQDGVYVWRIEARSLTSSEKKEITGFVTVLR